jgi:hypothetical protein
MKSRKDASILNRHRQINILSLPIDLGTTTFQEKDSFIMGREITGKSLLGTIAAGRKISIESISGNRKR